jgi:hypothetical protein
MTEEDSAPKFVGGGMDENLRTRNIVARRLQRISHIDHCSASHMHADVLKIVALPPDSARRLVRGAVYV